MKSRSQPWTPFRFWLVYMRRLGDGDSVSGDFLLGERKAGQSLRLRLRSGLRQSGRRLRRGLLMARLKPCPFDGSVVDQKKVGVLRDSIGGGGKRVEGVGGLRDSGFFGCAQAASCLVGWRWARTVALVVRYPLIAKSAMNGAPGVFAMAVGRRGLGLPSYCSTA